MSEPKARPTVLARRRRPLWQRLLRLPEGKILLAGLIVLLAYATVVGLTRIWSQHMYHSLWTMTVTHIVGGWATGVSWAYGHDLSAWVVIPANMASETFLTLLFYPLFVFSCRRLLVIRPLEAAMARARAAAEAHHKTISKWGLLGVFLFVLIPSPMTGALVGSVIGFLIGLRPWVNMAAVLAGTYITILCGGIVLQRLMAQLEEFALYLPYVLVAVLLGVALILHVRLLMAKRVDKPAPNKDAPGYQGPPTR